MVTPEMILVHVESVFMKKLISAISREIKMIKQKRCVSFPCPVDHCGECVDRLCRSLL